MGRWYTTQPKQYKDFSMNSVSLVGRLGKDPETRTFGDKSVTKFTLATKGYGDNVDWHNIECWGKTGELAQKYLTKGQLAGISGAIRYSKKDEKFFTNIIADRIEFLSSKQDRDTVSASTPITPDNLDAELDDLF